MATDWTNEKRCLETVKQDGMALEFVKNQTSEICVQAILNDKDAKKYIRPEILKCKEFIQELLMETI